jgi:glycerol kinase
MLAGLAEGVWSSVSEVQDAWKLGQEFLPEQRPAEAAQLHDKWRRAIERSRAWASQ